MTRIEIQKLQKIIRDQTFVIDIQDRKLKILNNIEKDYKREKSDCEHAKGKLIAISRVMEGWQ